MCWWTTMIHPHNESDDKQTNELRKSTTAKEMETKTKAKKTNRQIARLRFRSVPFPWPNKYRRILLNVVTLMENAFFTCFFTFSFHLLPDFVLSALSFRRWRVYFSSDVNFIFHGFFSVYFALRHSMSSSVCTQRR